MVLLSFSVITSNMCLPYLPPCHHSPKKLNFPHSPRDPLSLQGERWCRPRPQR